MGHRARIRVDRLTWGTRALQLAGFAWCAALLVVLVGESFPALLPPVLVGVCRTFLISTVMVGLVGGSMLVLTLQVLDTLIEKTRARREAARVRRETDARETLERAVREVADSGPRLLSSDEVEKAIRLVMEGTEDAVRLACVAVSATDSRPADVAAVFMPHVLKKLAESSLSECLPLVADALRAAKPCLDLFGVYLSDHLRASRPDAWIDSGFMGHRHPNPEWQKRYTVLWEDGFPEGFIDSIALTVASAVSASMLNLNMVVSYYVYSFPLESLTRLSMKGVHVLAGLPVPGHDSIRPFWGPYGRHLLLARITTLTDEVADALSKAKRSILFDDLCSFPDTPGHVKLARRLATQRHVVLGASTVLSPTVTEILSSVTISPPSTIWEILYCDVTTVEDRNRIAAVGVVAAMVASGFTTP